MASEGKKLIKGKSGLRMVPVKESLSSPFTIAEPRWIPDGQCSNCAQCQGKFDFINRRHHCRRCGKCFCDTCCSTKVLLHRMLFVDPVRHCASCSNISKKENDFFEKHVKTLTTGGSFFVTQSGDTGESDAVFVCRLSPDHRHLEFENAHLRLDNILLADIESLQILTAETDSEAMGRSLKEGNTLASGLAMRFKDSCGEMQLIKMVVSPGSSMKQAQYWVASMQKAFKMIYDTRSA